MINKCVHFAHWLIVHAGFYDVKGQLVIPWRVSVLVNTILFVYV